MVWHEPRNCHVDAYLVNGSNHSRWTMLNSSTTWSLELCANGTMVTWFTAAVEIFPPRWKYSHRGGNVFQLIHSFSLDSLQRNLDFVVCQSIHVGSSSWFHIIQLIHYKWCENQACAQGEIAIMISCEINRKCLKCKSKRMSLMGHRKKVSKTSNLVMIVRPYSDVVAVNGYPRSRYHRTRV